MPPDKCSKYLAAIAFFRSHTFHSLLEIQALYGKLFHVSLLIPHAHAYLTSFEALISLSSCKPSYKCCSSKSLLANLDWWVLLLKCPLRVPLPLFTPYQALNTFSDASLGFGIGITYNTAWAAFAFKPDLQASHLDIA